MLKTLHKFILFITKNLKYSKEIVDQFTTTPSHWHSFISYVPQNISIPDGMSLIEYVLLGRNSYTNWFLSEDKKDYEIVEKALNKLKEFKMSMDIGNGTLFQLL